MPSNTLDTTLSQISSVTRKYIFKDVSDAITLANPLLFKLKDNQESVDGGDDIRVPLEVAFNNSFMWYQGGETLNVSNSDVLFSLVFPWAQANVAVSIPGLDKLKNMGSSRVVDIVKAKMENAKKSMNNAFGTGVYSAGTDPKSILGARTYLSTSNTYGGLSQTTESYIQAKQDTTSTVLSLSAMQTLFEQASAPPIKPNFITTTATLFSSYHALLTPIQRYTDSKVAQGAFDNLLFRSAPVVRDDYCPASNLVMWNTDFLKFISHSSRKFPGEMVDFVQPYNQDVSVAHIRWQGQMICTNPRFQANFTALAS